MGDLNALYDSGHHFGEDFRAITPPDWDVRTDLVEIVDCVSRLRPALTRRFDETMAMLHDATEIKTFLNGFCAGYAGSS